VDLLILPVIWAVVLIPPWIRRRREDRPAESILSFHRKLWELERTSLYSDASYDDVNLDPDFDFGGEPFAGPDGAAGAAADPPSPLQRQASRAALYRRRRIFFGLFVALIVTLAFAGLLGGAVAWSAHATVSFLFVAYIALLVRHHQRVVEQVAKVRYLTPIRAPRPAVVVLRSGSDG
jgi:hypothetical protein